MHVPFYANRRILWTRSIAFFFVFLFFAACQTVQPDKVLEFGDDPSESVTEAGSEAEPMEDGAPVYLWSPAKRQSTAGYYFLVGEYLSLKGDEAGSAPLLESAYNLDPNPFLAARLIAAQANSGEFEKALPEARKMVLLYPRSPQLRFLLGQLYARQGLVKDAEREIEKAIELDKTSEEFYLELAQLHQKRGDAIKAAVVLKDLVQALPMSVDGWTFLAKMYLATSQKKLGLQAAERAYDLNGLNPEVILVYALALELNDESKKAVALYEQIYRLNPNNEELIARMIALYRSFGDLNESLELLNELADGPTGNKPGLQMQRAIILWELKRYEEAAIILEKLAAEYPENDRLRYMSGLGQEKQQQYYKALSTLAGVPENSTFHGPAQIRIAMIYREQKKYDEASMVIDRLTQREDIDWEVYVIGAGVFAERESYSEAIALLQKGYARFPDKHRLLFLVGVYQERAGEIAKCIDTMRAVLKVDPNNSAALNFLGYIYAERGENLEEAEKLIRKALEIKQNDGYYLDSLAWVYYQRKDYKKAEEILLRALQILPNEGVILEHLADVYLATGNAEKAAHFYSKALGTELEKRDRLRIEKKQEQLNVKSAEAADRP